MLYEADAREIPLADGSVHCVVTSPPYWGLRDYGLGQWEGGDAECDHAQRLQASRVGKLDGGITTQNHSQEPWPSGVCGLCGAVQQAAGIGLEATLAEHLDSLVSVFRELRRVLRDDGTVWLNYGDAYSTGASGEQGSSSPTSKINKGSVASKPVKEFAPKNLMGLPWRVAFALQDDGWWLRSAIVWHKPNPMPESVRDRPTNAYEMVFLLTKRPRYFYDAEAIRIPAQYGYRNHSADWRSGEQNGDGHRSGGGSVTGGNPEAGANARNVWAIPTQVTGLRPGYDLVRLFSFSSAGTRRCR